MVIKKLSFENYRNLIDGDFEPCGEINLIYGDNAQGKTNLIEALCLFSGQKSFRGGKDVQLIKIGTEFSRLSLDFFSQEREQNAVIAISLKKEGTLNGVKLQSVTELNECFPVIVFAPSHLGLVKDGPKTRRQFLDTAISQLRPKYVQVLYEYNRAVTQRNAILRDVVYHSELLDMLDAFEDRIAKTGAYIISQRKKYLEAVNLKAPEIYAGLSQGRESFVSEYICTSGNGDVDELKTALISSRSEDTATGTTSTGPHRDDIDLRLDGLPVRVYGSQGQMRSVALALKLAETDVLERFTGEKPIAILDDVMSELDPSRQNFILNHIQNMQVFITCCDPGALHNFKAGKVFRVENGELRTKK